MIRCKLQETILNIVKSHKGLGTKMFSIQPFWHYCHRTEVYRYVVGKSSRGRLGLKYEDNIKVILRKKRCVDKYWNSLIQFREKRGLL